MRLPVTLLLLLLVAWVGVAEGKVYNKCELAEELERVHKLPREEVKGLVCIAEHGAGFDTSNTKWRVFYGLFHISNEFWCDQQGCGIPCSALLDVNLTDDLSCVRKVINDRESWQGKGNGLKAWPAYNKHCADKNLDVYMDDCWSGPNLIDARTVHLS